MFHPSALAYWQEHDVSRVVTDEGLGVKVQRFGIPDEFVQEAGSQMFLRKKYGLTAEQTVERI